jgi:hypothetical protein
MPRSAEIYGDLIRKLPDSVCIFRIYRPAESVQRMEVRSSRSEIMSPSLHISDVCHAISIRFLELRHDLLVRCASEPEQSITERILTARTMFTLDDGFFPDRHKIVIDGNQSHLIPGDRGVPRDSTSGGIGSGDSLMNGDWIAILT